MSPKILIFDGKQVFILLISFFTPGTINSLIIKITGFGFSRYLKGQNLYKEVLTGLEKVLPSLNIDKSPTSPKESDDIDK